MADRNVVDLMEAAPRAAAETKGSEEIGEEAA